MIISTPEYVAFCRRLMAEENLSIEEAFRIYDALHKEAGALGLFTHEDIWEGFEVDLRITEAMRALRHIQESKHEER